MSRDHTRYEKNKEIEEFRMSVSDSEFISSLHKEYHRSLYLKAYEILQNPHDAEDAVQSTLSALCMHVNQLRSYSLLHQRNYIYKSIINNSLRIAKKRGKNLLAALDVEELDNFEKNLSYDVNMTASLEILELMKIIEKLPKMQYNVFVMKNLLHMTDKEIAKQFGVKPATVRTTLLYARKHIQRLLLKDGDKGDE